MSVCTGKTKEKIVRNDEIVKEIYRKKYGLFENYIENLVVIRTEKIKLIWNKKTMETEKGQCNNQHDITVIDKNKEIIMFDVSVVKRERLQQVHTEKYHKYEESTRITKEAIRLWYSRTILIIITIEWIIQKKRIETLE